MWVTARRRAAVGRAGCLAMGTLRAKDTGCKGCRMQGCRMQLVFGTSIAFGSCNIKVFVVSTYFTGPLNSRLK